MSRRWAVWAPGFGFGWAPAISFKDDGGERAILSAYVTPIPEVRKKNGDENDWQRIRRAVLSMFGAIRPPPMPPASGRHGLFSQDRYVTALRFPVTDKFRCTSSGRSSTQAS